MNKTILALLLCLGLVAPPALAFMAAPASAQGPRLVIFAPWVDGVALVLRAGGDPVGPAAAPMGILAYAPDRPDFDDRLRAAGAWAVLEGMALARICGLERDEIRERPLS
ncbi:MAG: hypothetical protein ACSHW1_10580 [Yoonia sp.]|uniref:hypothetical protein n=1 Tax=Yoonia sp. TaxID=2212373 RepID=UPI003EF74EC4